MALLVPKLKLLVNRRTVQSLALPRVARNLLYVPCVAPILLFLMFVGPEIYFVCTACHLVALPPILVNEERPRCDCTALPSYPSAYVILRNMNATCSDRTAQPTAPPQRVEDAFYLVPAVVVSICQLVGIRVRVK